MFTGKPRKICNMRFRIVPIIIDALRSMFFFFRLVYICWPRAPKIWISLFLTFGAIFKNKSGLSWAINEKKVNSNFSSTGLSNVKLVDSCSSKLATLFGMAPENYRSEIGEISDLTRGRNCPAMVFAKILRKVQEFEEASCHTVPSVNN